MDLDKIPLMNALTRKMGWLGRKQRVVAQNIANADTPNYRAKTLRPENFKGLLDKAPGQARSGSRTRMAATNEKHFTGSGGATAGGTGSGGTSKAIEDGTPNETTANGNNVILEEQMMQMAETQMEYGLLVNIYRKQVGMLKASIGRGQR